MSTLENAQFNTLRFSGDWLEHIGEPEHNFKMLIYGHPKNGKTSYALQLAKYLTNYGKVWYNSIEEGRTKTFQDACRRNGLFDLPQRLFMMGDRYHYADTMEYLAGRDRGKFIFLDSRDYMKLTTEQYKRLTRKYPNKSFIIICWEQASKPAGKYAKDIEYMVDVVVHVEKFIAKSSGRFGGFKPYSVWPERAPVRGSQSNLFGS